MHLRLAIFLVILVRLDQVWAVISLLVVQGGSLESSVRPSSSRFCLPTSSSPSSSLAKAFDNGWCAWHERGCALKPRFPLHIFPHVHCRASELLFITGCKVMWFKVAPVKCTGASGLLIVLPEFVG